MVLEATPMIAALTGMLVGSAAVTSILTLVDFDGAKGGAMITLAFVFLLTGAVLADGVR